MTDRETGSEAMPDVDTMSDEDFASFKAEMEAASFEEGPVEKTPQPQAKTAPVPDPDDEDGDEPDADAAKTGTIPHGRWHRERERRKAAEQAVADERQRSERLEQRTHEMLTLLSRQMPQAEKEQQQETYEQAYARMKAAGDVVGIMELQNSLIVEGRQREQQQSEARAQQQREGQVINHITERVAQDFDAAANDDPTLGEAYTHVWNSSIRERIALGMPEAQAIRETQRAELQLYAKCLVNNLRPSEVIKALAAQRGFVPKAAGGEGDVGTTAAAEMDRLNGTKRAAKSLGGAGGEARTGVPSAADIASMSDKEFAAFKAKYGDDAMAVVMGVAA